MKVVNNLQFEWDEAKNTINKRKHGVSFEEARAVFEDELAILFDDPDYSENEDRFLIIGMTDRKGICIVSHCYRGTDEKIRIISARKATKTEQNIYNEQPFWR